MSKLRRRVRIKTLVPNNHSHRVRGQDVGAFIVEDDGTEVPIPGVVRVSFAADSRLHGARVLIEIARAEIDALSDHVDIVAAVESLEVEDDG